MNRFLRLAGMVVLCAWVTVPAYAAVWVQTSPPPGNDMYGKWWLDASSVTRRNEYAFFALARTNTDRVPRHINYDRDIYAVSCKTGETLASFCRGDCRRSLVYPDMWLKETPVPYELMQVVCQ